MSALLGAPASTLRPPPASCVYVTLPPPPCPVCADIPVTMDCSQLDGNLLGTFWDRQQQARRQQQQLDTHQATTAPFSSSSSNGKAQQAYKAGSTPPQQQQQQQSSSVLSPSPSGTLVRGRPLLDRQQLPYFSDRLLVFHR